MSLLHPLLFIVYCIEAWVIGSGAKVHSPRSQLQVEKADHLI